MAVNFLKLTPELLQIDAMLGDLAASEENHGHVEIVESAQLRIGVDINLEQSSTKFREQGSHLRFGFLA